MSSSPCAAAAAFFDDHSYLFSVGFPDSIATAFAAQQVEVALAPQQRRQQLFGPLEDDDEEEEAAAAVADVVVAPESKAAAGAEAAAEAATSRSGGYFRDTCQTAFVSDEDTARFPEDESVRAAAPLMLWHPERGGMVETLEMYLSMTTGTPPGWSQDSPIYWWLLNNLRHLRALTDGFFNYVVVCDDATTLVPRSLLVTRRTSRWPPPASPAAPWEKWLGRIVARLRQVGWMRVEPAFVGEFGAATWGTFSSPKDDDGASCSRAPGLRRTQVRLNDLGWRRRFRLTEVQNTRLQQLRVEERNPRLMRLRGLPLDVASGTYMRFRSGFRPDMDLVYHARGPAAAAAAADFTSRIYAEHSGRTDVHAGCVRVTPPRAATRGSAARRC